MSRVAWLISVKRARECAAYIISDCRWNCWIGSAGNMVRMRWYTVISRRDWRICCHMLKQEYNQNCSKQISINCAFQWVYYEYFSISFLFSRYAKRYRDWNELKWNGKGNDENKIDHVNHDYCKSFFKWIISMIFFLIKHTQSFNCHIARLNHNYPIENCTKFPSSWHEWCDRMVYKSRLRFRYSLQFKPVGLAYLLCANIFILHPYYIVNWVSTLAGQKNSCQRNEKNVNQEQNHWNCLVACTCTLYTVQDYVVFSSVFFIFLLLIIMHCDVLSFIFWTEKHTIVTWIEGQ